MKNFWSKTHFQVGNLHNRMHLIGWKTWTILSQRKTFSPLMSTFFQRYRSKVMLSRFLGKQKKLQELPISWFKRWKFQWMKVTDWRCRAAGKILLAAMFTSHRLEKVFLSRREATLTPSSALPKGISGELLGYWDLWEGLEGWEGLFSWKLANEKTVGYKHRPILLLLSNIHFRLLKWYARTNIFNMHRIFAFHPNLVRFYSQRVCLNICT